MKINFYFRNSRAGYSIGSVFDTVCQYVAKRILVKKTYLPSPFANLLSILKNGIYAKKQEVKGSINHITGDVHYLLYFLNHKHTIVTVHDIMYYHYLKSLKKKVWYYIYIYPLKRAAFVTFISDFACKQVLKEISLEKNKIRIIPNPVDSSFIYAPKSFNSEKPIILHVGTLERKNLTNTIKALKGISCHLRIIGTLNDKQKNLLVENHIDYSNECNLSHQQIVNEYKLADIVNFPSLFEGFGMPIIEAQATGRVVITSNLSPMKEVAGAGAVLIDPTSIVEIRKAYLEIINNENLRWSVIRNGKQNVEKYRIENISAEYIKLYNQINNENFS